VVSGILGLVDKCLYLLCILADDNCGRDIMVAIKLSVE
jgi:hypothetical protein